MRSFRSIIDFLLSSFLLFGLTIHRVAAFSVFSRHHRSRSPGLSAGLADSLSEYSVNEGGGYGNGGSEEVLFPDAQEVRIAGAIGSIKVAQSPGQVEHQDDEMESGAVAKESEVDVGGQAIENQGTAVESDTLGDEPRTDAETRAGELQDSIVEPDTLVPDIEVEIQTPAGQQQYAAMEPGTVVQIQVGDISLARKAWKKRRRSGSPLLVPCSVLNVDRQSTVRWNLIYLLEKFGSSVSKGIRISLSELSRRSRSHLKSSLDDHAEALGYGSVNDMVEHLFSKQIQDTYGVKLVQHGNSLWLHAPLSRMRAQKRASGAAVLQFQEGEQDDALQHTGFVRYRHSKDKDSPSGSIYQHSPLSAALRVTQADVDNGTIQNGSMHAAVVFDFDLLGDAGAPLLTLSLNPARNQVRDRLKLSDSRFQGIRNPRFLFHDLKVGFGPIEGKVVRFVKGGALIDCGIGRKLNTPSAPDLVKVFGMLPFKDTVDASFQQSIDDIPYDIPQDEEEDESYANIFSFDDLDLDETEVADDVDEEETTTSPVASLFSELDVDNDEEFADSEDITDQFELTEEGSLVYLDPQTGETKTLLGSEDDLAEDQEEAHSSSQAFCDGDIDMESTTPVSEHSRAPPPFYVAGPVLPTKRLHLGDTVQVFVRSVSKQNGRFFLTMNSSVQGKKARDLKRESVVSKKMSRLTKQLGGLHRVEELLGLECDGTVKATSAVGDWMYVQPLSHNLPVGVASVPEELRNELAQGDSVRIQLEGIDETRGQLALRVLMKS